MKSQMIILRKSSFRISLKTIFIGPGYHPVACLYEIQNKILMVERPNFPKFQDLSNSKGTSVHFKRILDVYLFSYLITLISCKSQSNLWKNCQNSQDHRKEIIIFMLFLLEVKGGYQAMPLRILIICSCKFHYILYKSLLRKSHIIFINILGKWILKKLLKNIFLY